MYYIATIHTSMFKSWKNFFIALVVFATLLFAYNNMNTPSGSGARPATIDYSEFLKQVNDNNVQSVVINQNRIKGKYQSGEEFKTVAPNDANLISTLTSKKVSIKVDEGERSMLATILIQWFPMLLFIAIWIFFMRQMQGGGRGGGAFGFGKSRAKLLTPSTGKVTFADVAGVEEAKEELKEIVDFLKNPKKFQSLGGKIPRGVLLVGPPGTGKTLIARAVAGEASVPFFSISGSDFVEMFVGVGASRVRDMFEQAKKASPCIVFIDEVDAVGRHRGAGLGGGNDEREQTLNQILVEMDGFSSNENVIIIGATNRPDVLDPALLRPGRFDRQVVVPNPDIKGRTAILEVHLKKVKLAGDVKPEVIARGTPGFSGADLANLVNEAALLAVKRNRKFITMQELEAAKDKVMIGTERRSMVMSDDEKKLTAYHEAGHAVVMLHVKGHEPLHKVTIIPRGRALGVTFALPERDRLSMSLTQLKAQLASLFGGRVAEEMIFGKDNITTGASNDIMQATKLARRMVTEFGFSDKLGPLRYSDNEEEVFLGHSVTQKKMMSDATAKLIDEEVRRLVEGGEAMARDILRKFANQLEVIAQGLLQYETLDRKEIDELLKGKMIVSQSDKQKKWRARGSSSLGFLSPRPKPTA